MAAMSPSWISFSSISGKVLRWTELIFGGCVGIGQMKVGISRWRHHVMATARTYSSVELVVLVLGATLN